MAKTRVGAIGTWLGLCGAGALLACGDDGGRGTATTTTTTTTTGMTTTATSLPTTSGEPTGGTDGSGGTGTQGLDVSSGGVKFDIGGEAMTGTTTGAPVDLCKVADDVDGDAGSCNAKAPPDSFNPEVQWSWPGVGVDVYSGTSPLVANLTDDNGDGAIDLCDVPEIVVIAGPGDDIEPDTGHMYVLDGGTGVLQFSIADDLYGFASPALGDLDGDGVSELVALGHGDVVRVYEHDGTFKWASLPVSPGASRSAIAIADIDADGSPEVLAAASALSAAGDILWTIDGAAWLYATPVAADLDGDGKLEVIFGDSAYHHDGSLYWKNPDLQVQGLPQVADLDADGLPEVLFANPSGLTLVEHDGATKPGHLNLRLTGAEPIHEYIWMRPAAVHDFDGDDKPEFSHSSSVQYAVYDTNPVAIHWQAQVFDASGAAGGTAFDFIAAGAAQAMYADEKSLFVFDENGDPLLEVPHRSYTYIEFPVVADVDNDGSAEIVVVSNQGGGPPSPTVQVIRDTEDRWIQARRIWNQHTYHVSNVREDGTIPQVEPNHWKLLNTFRTQAQIEGGSVCIPPG